MKRLLVSESQPLTFSDYFKLSADVDEVVPYFGYSFEARTYILPATARTLEGVAGLKARLEKVLPHLSLTSEAARREFLIAPILMELVQYTGGRIKVEYPLQVTPQLQGTLDYFLQVENSLVVIEAKNADLTKGFTQLAVELIALDKWVEHDAPFLYGAVSIGDVWQFGILDRQAKKVTQDLNLYLVPRDLETLMRILVGILTE
jgi:hypothetical protein